MDTGGYTALNFVLHDSHVLNAKFNVFMRPLGRVGIYRVLLYNLYSGARVTDVPYIIIYGLRTFNSSMWGSLRLAPIIIDDIYHNIGRIDPPDMVKIVYIVCACRVLILTREMQDIIVGRA